MTGQKFTKFLPSKFLHIYGKVSHEHQTNWLEDISKACAQQVAAGVPSITFLTAMAYGSREFLVSHSQGKSTSAKRLSNVDWYSQYSLEPLNLYKTCTCKLSFYTHN